MTLRHLPKRKVRTLKQKVAMASTIAAAIALFAVFAAPPIVRAAGQLYTRLFGDVIADIETEQAKPEDQKFDEMLAMYEDGGGWHTLSDASQMLDGVEISLENVGLSPVDYQDRANNPKGELSISLAYDKIPSFDPNYVDFVLVVDGKDIPLPMSENLEMYREAKYETLTEEQWENGSWSSNSFMQPYGPRTNLRFPVDDWKWDKLTPLVLKATIDGQQLEIPFAYSPEKAHEQAVADANTSLKLVEEHYEREKDELAELGTNVVPVGLSGSAFKHDYEISEVSIANGKLFFTVSIGGVKEKNLRAASHLFWLNVLSVDEYGVLSNSSDNDTLENGTYTAVYQYDLGRDADSLPDESLMAVRLELGSVDKTKDLAFRCNWKQKLATLPVDDAQMQDWLKQADALREQRRSSRSQEVFGVDLGPLNLAQTADGVTMRVTGIRFNAEEGVTEFRFDVSGDVKKSKYMWGSNDARVSVDGYAMNLNFGGEAKNGTMSSLSVFAPLDQSEFGIGEKYAFEYKLYEKDYDKGDAHSPTSTESLIFEFSVDRNALPALQLDEDGFIIE